MGPNPVKNLHYYNNENTQVYPKYSNDNNITNINQAKLLQNRPKNYNCQRSEFGRVLPNEEEIQMSRI